MDLPSIIVLSSAGAVMAAVAVVWAVLPRRRVSRDAAALARATEEQRHIPVSLHPVIDANICIGSLSCITACPEGDILGIVQGHASLIEAARCIGHGRCAVECPVDAIKLVFGSAQRGVDLPEVDEDYQTSRPGVFVVGELGGMGLIKNAFSQGLEAGRRLAGGLGGAPDGSDTIADALVVGAGPAGLGAAIALKSGGRRVRVVDQEGLGGAILRYPRHKIVMTEKAQIPGFGQFGKARMTKQELLDGIRRLAAHFELAVEEKTKVSAIDGEDGAFVVGTDRGPIRARKVILAIGRRGSPRRLGVPGEDLPKVTYQLTDPEQYTQKRILVVGGGDSAVEAAVTLAKETDAEVTIAHRGPAFARCRAANLEAMEAERASGRVRVLFSTEVARIEPDAVHLTAGGTPEALPNDYVVICAGGELPLQFLETARVQLTRHVGDKAVAPPVSASARERRSALLGAPDVEETLTRRFNWLLLITGVVIVAALASYGADYYLLSHAERLKSPLHRALRPAGPIGLNIGLIATVVMLSNFAYALRKRWRRLKGAAPIARWMSFHVFVGLLSPAVISFHAAFQWNNTIATSTFISLIVLVSTGLIGRFAYGLIPRVDGKVVESAVLAARAERLRDTAYRAANKTTNPTSLRQLVKSLYDSETQDRGLLEAIMRAPSAFVSTRLALRRCRSLFSSPEEYTSFRETAIAIQRTRVAIELSRAVRRFLGWWRVLHVMVAIFVVLVMAVHIGIAIYLGYWKLPFS